MLSTTPSPWQSPWQCYPWQSP